MATILIVDDRPTNRELLVTLLGYGGHRLLEAAEGEQGLAIARTEHPDLIITDIVMPTMDGYEFARQVRADTTIRETQIIFHTSSYIVEETLRLAEACGVHTVLAKPFEPEMLLDTVRSALESTAAPVITASPSEDFHREHMRLLTDTLAQKVEELESEITERRRAEERFRLVVESAPNAILAVNREGLIEMVNSQAETLFGYDRTELVGLTVDSLVPEQLRGIHPNHRLSYFTELETRPMGAGRSVYAIRKDGTTFPVEIGLTPITTAEGLLVIATVVDITLRKLAQEQVALQNQRLRVLREIDLAILAAASTEEIVGAALHHTRDLIACRRANLTLIDRDTNELVIFEMRTTADTSIPKGSRLPIAQFEEIIQTLSQNQPIVFNDLRELENPIAGIQRLLKDGLRSTCSMPLFSQGNLIGMFSMHSEIPGFFDEGKVNLGREVANQVAIAITQKQLTEAVQESESNQKGLLESTDDQMWSLDTNYCLITGNTKFQDYIQQVRGRTLAPGESLLQDGISPELLHEWRSYFDRALGGETFMVETQSQLVQPPRYREFRFHPIFGVEGQVIGAAVSGRDITERRRAEERLRQSEANFSKAFNSSPTALLITRRADGKFLEMNKAYTSIVGYERGELLGHLSTEFNIFTRPDERNEIVSQLVRDGSLYNYEAQIQIKSGELRTVLASLEMIQFNEEDCILTTIVDITERKQAEEALRVKNEEINAMSQQLWQAAKLATMGELAASIAHELNNPLATVSLRAEMLQVQFGPEDPQFKSLQIIESEVKRMSSLVMNLLQFSRRSASQTSTIDVNDEVANSLELVQYHLRKSSVLTVQELSSDLPMVQADRQQLRQVFLNLFTNAVDAMPLGGMLTIRSWSGEKPDAGITAPLRPSTNQSLGLPTPAVPQVFIEVSDTGEGIRADHLERVWEPFYTTKPEGKGTGLGLAICRRIIQEHGGNIKVLSEGVPGKGTTIQLTLPAQKEG